MTTTAEQSEPPKYLGGLIAAVNDGAKAAQGGAFLFLLVGLYLLATAFSPTSAVPGLGLALFQRLARNPDLRGRLAG